MVDWGKQSCRAWLADSPYCRGGKIVTGGSDVNVSVAETIFLDPKLNRTGKITAIRFPKVGDPGLRGGDSPYVSMMHTDVVETLYGPVSATVLAKRREDYDTMEILRLLDWLDDTDDIRGRVAHSRRFASVARNGALLGKRRAAHDHKRGQTNLGIGCGDPK